MAVAVLSEMRHQRPSRLITPHFPPFIRKLAGIIGWNNLRAQALILCRALLNDNSAAPQSDNPLREHIVRMPPSLRILIAGIKTGKKLIVARQITYDVIDKRLRRLETKPGLHEFRVIGN